MPRRTNDPCASLSLSIPASAHVRLRRLADEYARRGYSTTSIHALAKDLLLATLRAQEEAMNLPAYVPPPVLRAEPVFVPGSPAHLRSLQATPSFAQGHAPAAVAPPPMSLREMTQAGLLHVAPGLDAHDDFAEVVASVVEPPSSTLRTADILPRAPAPGGPSGAA